jgi:hypothetical protein
MVRRLARRAIRRRDERRDHRDLPRVSARIRTARHDIPLRSIR